MPALPQSTTSRPEALKPSRTLSVRLPQTTGPGGPAQRRRARSEVLGLRGRGPLARAERLLAMASARDYGGGMTGTAPRGGGLGLSLCALRSPLALLVGRGHPSSALVSLAARSLSPIASSPRVSLVILQFASG